MDTAAARAASFVPAPPRGARPLVREWSSLPRQYARLRRDPVWRGVGVPDGGGARVLLVPGFMAGDSSLLPLASWLRRCGYQPSLAGMRVNMGCALELLARLERRAEWMTERSETPLAIVGQSRGGFLARLLVARRPELFDRMVTMGSPTVAPLAAHPLVLRHIAVLASLGSRGARGVIDRDCMTGTCADEVAALLDRPFPSGVDYTSVYSKADGIVDWRACLDPDATCLEVRSTHVAMSVHPDVYRILGRTLAPA